MPCLVARLSQSHLACSSLFGIDSLAVGAVGTVPCMYAACLVNGSPFLNESQCEVCNLVLGIYVSENWLLYSKCEYKFSKIKFPYRWYFV